MGSHTSANVSATIQIYTRFLSQLFAVLLHLYARDVAGVCICVFRCLYVCAQFGSGVSNLHSALRCKVENCDN